MAENDKPPWDETDDSVAKRDDIRLHYPRREYGGMSPRKASAMHNCRASTKGSKRKRDED